jgi:head-tail adaptor
MAVTGKKRAYCEIQSPTRTADGQGGWTVTWSNYGYEWFQAIPQSQNRTLDQGGIKYRMAVEFRGNKRSDLVITGSNRIVWNAENYTIHSVVPSEMLDEITIIAYV